MQDEQSVNEYFRTPMSILNFNIIFLFGIENTKQIYYYINTLFILYNRSYNINIDQ